MRNGARRRWSKRGRPRPATLRRTSVERRRRLMTGPEPPRSVTGGGPPAAAVAALTIAALLWVIGPIGIFGLFFGDSWERPDPRDVAIPYFFGGLLLAALAAAVPGFRSRRQHRFAFWTTVVLMAPWLVLSL